MGKIPIVVKDDWGFYVARVQNTYILEGITLLQEGYPPALIENLGLQAGMPKGALAFADDLSLKMVLKYENQAAAHYGSQYEPHPAVSTLTKMVGELDRSGKFKQAGFYEYDGDNGPVVSGSALGALNGEQKWVDTVLELMAKVDEWIEEPVREIEKDFLMPIEDVFSITGRGTVATGRIETGIANTGDPVEIIGMGAQKLTSTITGIEMFRQILDRGEAGDNAGILLRGIEKDQISRGMVICKPGSVTPHAKFKAEVYVLKKEEGGRHTPFHNNYRPQFYVRTTDVTGTINLPDGVEMVMPGDNLTITVDLIQPIAMNLGLRFAIREGGRTVGAGQVTEILD